MGGPLELGLLAGAWTRRHTPRLVDAVYIEITEQLVATFVTTDARLAGTTDLGELVQNR